MNFWGNELLWRDLLAAELTPATLVHVGGLQIRPVFVCWKNLAIIPDLVKQYHSIILLMANFGRKS